MGENTWVRLPTLCFWVLRFFWRLTCLPHPLTNIFRQLKTQKHKFTPLLLVNENSSFTADLITELQELSQFGHSNFKSSKMIKENIKTICYMIEWGSHSFPFPFNIHSFIFSKCFNPVRGAVPIPRDSNIVVKIYPSPFQRIRYSHTKLIQLLICRRITHCTTRSPFFNYQLSLVL